MSIEIINFYGGLKVLSYLTNKYLKEQRGFQNEGEWLFVQKMKELLHRNSGVSYSYKIHNAYSILKELKAVIEDLQLKRTNGLILEEVRKEAKEILENDIVMKNKRALYDTISSEIRQGFCIDKNSQSISGGEMARVHSIQMILNNMEKEYDIMEYLKDTLDCLKQAILDNKGTEILQLTECVVSSIIETGHSIDSSYKTFTRFFENKREQKTFDECWVQWVGSLVRIEAEYMCFFKIPEQKCADKIENKITAQEIKVLDLTQQLSEDIELIDGEVYFKVEISTPANDMYIIVEKAFAEYRKEMGIVEFAMGAIDSLENDMLVYDKFFKTLRLVKKSENQREVYYKPYNQYHKNIDRVVRNLLENINNEFDKNRLINAIVNCCNFEKEGKEYEFLLLWSSLESLFRSNQYITAISAIKDIVPNILSYRYIYYRLFDFLKDCKNIHLEYSYRGTELIVDQLNDEKIKLLYDLLRDESANELFLQECRKKYELLYFRGLELKNILRNAQSIKQKIERHRVVVSYQLQRMYRSRNRFVHHSIVDKNIDALCKHIQVYLWEAIRELGYVSTDRKKATLEELYSYFRMNYIMMQKSLLNKNSQINIDQILKGYL